MDGTFVGGVMGFSVSVVTGTFGGKKWVDLAYKRAFKSVPDNVPWIHAHRDTLHEARNAALASVETEFVIHLDADDELEPGYIEAMAEGTADVRGPMARMVTGNRQRLWQPRVWGHEHDCSADCLEEGNFVVVGAAARTELVREVGGWRDFPWSEDWDVWLRCRQAGATFELIRDAVYRAHVRHASRNRSPSREAKAAAHRAIHEANFPVAA